MDFLLYLVVYIFFSLTQYKVKPLEYLIILTGRKIKKKVEVTFFFQTEERKQAEMKLEVFGNF